MTAAKGAVGLWTGSHALVADAVHSAADVAGSVAVIVGLAIARKPPDEDHPYGHGKAELISAGVVAGILMLAALDVLYEAVRALFVAPVLPHRLAAVTALVAVVVKEALFRYNYRLGRRTGSPSLVASAYEHRSDVYASLAALFGIVLALAGQAASVRWLLYMDPVASGVVAILVFWMGYRMAADASHSLMDRTMDDQDLHPYRERVMAVPGVERIDALYVRDHGQYVIVDVKVSVDARMTVAAGHEIAARVKQELRQAFPRVQDVLVHVNPHFAGGETDDERGERP